MRRVGWFASLLLSLTSLLLIACENKPLVGPPQLRLGRDQCHECGMIISEDRCAAALLIERDGRREHLLFDDLGCMLDVERGGLDAARVIERFARDHDTRAWIDAATATFLSAPADKLITPMASGMVGYAARSAAGASQAQYGGSILNYEALADARRAWMQARRSTSSRPGE
ncbi:MAG: nitrous oxide reductase accessory protein NosL [Phycisphaerae bacterium]